MEVYVVKLYSDRLSMENGIEDIETYIFKDRVDADNRLKAEYISTKHMVEMMTEDPEDVFVEYDKSHGYFSINNNKDYYSGKIIKESIL